MAQFSLLQLLLYQQLFMIVSLANKIRIAIENKIIIDEFKINITASFGVAQFKGDFSSSFDASYKLADKALYQAKKQGRNQVVIASFTKEE